MADAMPPAAEIQRAATLFRNGQDAEAAAVAAELTRRHPSFGPGWLLLGSSLKRLGRLAEAVGPLQRAVDLMPGRAELHSNLGATIYHLGREPEAERAYRDALALDPRHADALFNLGRLQTKQERYVESSAIFGKLVGLRPDDGEAHFELGVALAGQERWLAAEQCHRTALDRGHAVPIVFEHLGRALLEQGRSAEALDVLRQGLAAGAPTASLLRNLLFTANHVPARTAPGLLPEAAAFDALLGAAGKPFTRWRCETSPAVLRIGFVSGDFRRHPVASFLAGFIPHLREHGIELHAYATNRREDAVTVRLKESFARWESIEGLAAAEAAAKIEADGIHILFDLSGHTAGNRLDVFALAAAPVQVTWLGVPATTGLQGMDCILSDPHAHVAGDEAWFSERLVPLAESWFCYAPLEPAPEVSATPALTSGHVTFGSFNSLTKINAEVIATWAGILQRVPGARLLMRCWQLTHEDLREQVRQAFATHGIATERLQLEGPIVSLRSHLAEYGRVDIALDSFPYVGGTTTAEALFMGVPVVTLRGSGKMLRLGESLLRQAALSECIAADPQAYVERAVALAADLPRLAALRSDLRDRLAATALFDGRRFAAQFAQAMWSLWTTSPRRQAPA